MSNALNELVTELNEVAVSTTGTGYILPPGWYSVAIGDGGSLADCYLKGWDGVAYLAYSESDGTASQIFAALVPPSGKVQLAFTAGSAVLSMHPFHNGQ